MSFQGVIIAESLRDPSILQDIHTVSTKVEPITPEHKTPWLKQWTLYNVEIPEAEAAAVADKLSETLEPNYWYADFKNDTTHYIVFSDKVFTIDRTKAAEYQAATDYGLSLGVPDYQLNFASNVIRRKRPAA